MLNAKLGVALIVGFVVFCGLVTYLYVDKFQNSTEYRIVTDNIRDVIKQGDQIAIVMGNGSCCEQTHLFYSNEKNIDLTVEIVNLYKGDYVTILYQYNSATDKSTLIHIKPIMINDRWG